MEPLTKNLWKLARFVKKILFMLQPRYWIVLNIGIKVRVTWGARIIEMIGQNIYFQNEYLKQSFDFGIALWRDRARIEWNSYKNVKTNRTLFNKVLLKVLICIQVNWFYFYDILFEHIFIPLHCIIQSICVKKLNSKTKKNPCLNNN